MLKTIGKKLQIAMYLTSDPSKTGGVQEHTYHLVNSLKALGHSVTVFGSSSRSQFKKYTQIGRLVDVPLINGNWINITIPTHGHGKISEIINSSHFDICHIHEPYLPFIAWDIIAHVSIPKVVTFHAAWDNESSGNIISHILPILSKSVSKNIDGAIFISKVVQHRWRAICLEAVYQKIIYYGIDHTTYFPIEIKTKNDPVKLLFVARLVRKKGLMYLLEALNLLNNQKVPFMLKVLGDGADRNKFEMYVRENGLSGHVEFKGEIFGIKKAPFYQNADIFCAPYWDEGFGLSVLEAMTCGCALIGFQNSAFSDWLKDYPEKDLFVPKKDVSALARALESLISDNQMRNNLRSWVVKESRKYSWDKVADETQNLYYRVIHEKKYAK